MRKPRAAADGTAGERVPEAAARALVRDLQGNERELRQLWAERPVLLVFVRHFG